MAANSRVVAKLMNIPAYRVYREKAAGFVELLKMYEVGKIVDPKTQVQAAARMVGLEIRQAVKK